jgi:hypothetical protein
LAQMRMIGSLKLVFNEHSVVGGSLLAQHVGSKGPHTFFLDLQGEIKADGVSQEFEMLCLGEPGGQVNPPSWSRAPAD